MTYSGKKNNLLAHGHYFDLSELFAAKHPAKSLFQMHFPNYPLKAWRAARNFFVINASAYPGIGVSLRSPTCVTVSPFYLQAPPFVNYPG